MSHEIQEAPKHTAEAPQTAAQAMFHDSHPSPPSAGREASAAAGDKAAGPGEKPEQAGSPDAKADSASAKAKPDAKPDAQSDNKLGLPKVEFFDSQAGGAKTAEAAKTGADAPKNNVDAAKQTLGDNNASAEDKLKSAHTLADAGVSKVQIADKDGKMHDYRIETEKAGQNTMVHMYEKGASGKENVALRGVERADGSMAHQKDSRGRDVAFEGAHSEKSPAQGYENVRTHSRHSQRPQGEAQGQQAPEKSAQPEVQPPKANRLQDKAPEVKAPEAKAPEAKAPEVKAPEATQKESVEPSAKQMEHTLPVDTDAKQNDLQITSQHDAKATGYYPFNNAQEGGYKDMKGAPLHTLQQYLNGKAPYVSVAMDNKAGIHYGQKVNIPELNQKYGKDIPFRVVDTGSAFRNKGTSRIDICTESHAAANAPSVNGKLTLQFVR